MQVLQLLIAVSAIRHTNFLKVQRDVPGHTEGAPPPPAEGPDVNETTVISDEPVTEETVETTVEHQIEHSLSPTVVMDCVEDDCSEQTITACHMLWTAKLRLCIDNHEAWSGFCGAPKYKDGVTGALRDCKQGCCSPVAQGTAVVLEKAKIDAVEGSEPETEEGEEEEGLRTLTEEQTEDIVQQIAEKTNGGQNPLTREEIAEIAASVKAKAKEER